MSDILPLYRLLEIDVSGLSQKACKHFDAQLFVCIQKILLERLRGQYKAYFRLLHISIEMENSMLEAYFIRSIIKDILETGEYTLAGIAYYTRTSDEVIYDLAMGYNPQPSAILLRKLFELHKETRPDLYEEIREKISTNIRK